MNELQHLAELDARLVAAVRPIRLLSAASWPARIQAQFLDSWQRDEPVLPKIDYPRFDLADTRRELDAVIAAADPAHPIGDYLRRSAGAYHTAAEIMEALG